MHKDGGCVWQRIGHVYVLQKITDCLHECLLVVMRCFGVRSFVMH